MSKTSTHRALSGTTSSARYTASAVSSLLTSILRPTLLFQHDPTELGLWLDALPVGIRAPGTESPDDAPLKDEKSPVLAFFEECLMRCGRTPHRYLEELDTIFARNSSSISTSDSAVEITVQQEGNTVPRISPVMVVCLEQLAAKVKCSLLEASDILAIVTFIRKVIVAVIGKQSSPELCSVFISRLEKILGQVGVAPEYPVMTAAWKSECLLLKACVSQCRSTRGEMELTGGMNADIGISKTVDSFLEQIETIEPGKSCCLDNECLPLLSHIIIFRRPEVIRRRHTSVRTRRLGATSRSTAYCGSHPASRSGH
jgi:hypothetical protein